MEYITAFRKASNLSKSNEQELAVEKEIEEAEVEENTGLTKALDAYRKIKSKHHWCQNTGSYRNCNIDKDILTCFQ